MISHVNNYHYQYHMNEINGIMLFILFFMWFVYSLAKSNDEIIYMLYNCSFDF